jgi:hypothetical protein
LDEYMTEGDAAPDRFLQIVVNATNSTVESPEEKSVPWIPLALVGLGGAGAAGYFMTRPGYTYETYDYDQAEGGLMEEYDDYDDVDYDEEEYE